MSIEVKNVSYTYMPGTPFESKALDNVSLTIEEGSFTAIAGHTGSGKSTLVQHLNGLLQPTAGQIIVDGQTLAGKGKEVKAARDKVGMVFQYPEHQLFEETVEADIAFGPKNRELSEAEITARVKMAMEFVGLDYEIYRSKSPFSLSGGQMRRVAIAGVIALSPKYLVLDEPTAGLNPAGRDELLEKIKEFHDKRKMTIVFVSHDMDAIARYADRVIVLSGGNLVLDAAPTEVFANKETIEEAGLLLPRLTTLLRTLDANGLKLDMKPKDMLTVEGAVRAIMAAKKAAPKTRDSKTGGKG